MSDQGPIIFPTDFSVASLAGLEWAKRMAATTGTALHVVYVVEEPQVFRILDLPAGPAALPTADVLISAAEQRLDRICQCPACRYRRSRRDERIDSATRLTKSLTAPSASMQR